MVNKNIICWSDVLIFEDGSFELFISPVEIVKDLREDFAKHHFSTDDELDKFFGRKKVIYDCDNFEKAAKEKFKKPFKSLFLDSVIVSDNLLMQIKRKIDLPKCGGYINGLQF